MLSTVPSVPTTSTSEPLITPKPQAAGVPPAGGVAQSASGVGVGVGAGVVVLDGLLLVVALAVGVVWVEPQDVRTNAKTAIPPRPDRFIVVDPISEGSAHLPAFEA